MRSKLGARGMSLEKSLSKSRHRLSRRARRGGMDLARVEELSQHPRLSMTLDDEKLGRSAADLRDYLEAIDVADRRKGWWLGMLGGLAFNMILFFVLLLAVLRWRGFI